MSCNQSRRSMIMNLGSLFIKQSTIMARVVYLHTISAYACNLTDIYLSGCRPPVSSNLHMTHIKISKLNQIMIGTNLVVALNGKDELVTTPVLQCQDPYCIAFTV